jgi:uncharacterized protein YbaR (Trm112 family)
VILEEASEVDVDMVQQIISKLDYGVLKQAYVQIYDALLLSLTTIEEEGDATTTTIDATNRTSFQPPPYLPDTIPCFSRTNTDHKQTSVESLPTTETASVIDTDNCAPTALNEKDAETTAVTDIDEYQNELKTIFCALFEIHVMEGVLICPDTQREFPIKDGIPNMILHEDEL